MNYFTSDIYFFRERLPGENDSVPRLFANIGEMNRQLITGWSAVVKEMDHVYHLGDLAVYPQYKKANADTLKLVSRLQGVIHLIEGNHDSRAFFRYLEKNDSGLSDGSPRFYLYDVGTIVKFDHQQYYLTHYPMLLRSNNTIRNLHGHIHYYGVPIENVINVGVDAPERDPLKERLPFGTPLSEKQIKEIYEAKRSWKSYPASSDKNRQSKVTSRVFD